MLAGFQIGAFTGWVVGYATVYSRFEDAASAVLVIQTVPVAPDTIFCMAAGAAIGALVGLIIEKAKAEKAKAPKSE